MDPRTNDSEARAAEDAKEEGRGSSTACTACRCKWRTRSDEDPQEIPQDSSSGHEEPTVTWGGGDRSPPRSKFPFEPVRKNTAERGSRLKVLRIPLRAKGRIGVSRPLCVLSFHVHGFFVFVYFVQRLPRPSSAWHESSGSRLSEHATDDYDVPELESEPSEA